MKLAAEKNLNRYSFPVIATKGKPLCHNQVLNKAIPSFFAKQEYMAEADDDNNLLGTYMIHGTYNFPSKREIDYTDRIPTSNDKRVQKYVTGMHDENTNKSSG